MFGGEEDFFDDDDFLQDVLQIETAGESSKTNESVSQILSNASFQDKKVCEVLKKQFVPQKNVCASKYVTDDSFDFSDDFPFELGNEGTVSGQQSQGDNMPPDSAFTAPQPSLSPRQHTDGDSRSVNSNKISDGNVDFRRKILKTLNETKKYNPLSQDSFRTKVLLESVKNNSMSTLRSEKRKVPHDVSEDDMTCASFSGKTHSTENNEFTLVPQSSLPVNDYQQAKGKNFALSSMPIKPDAPVICTIRSPGGPLIQKRKFPGPAGILPDLGSSATESSVLKLQKKAAPVPVPQEAVCSQNSANDFTSGPWQQMLDDLELDQNNPKCPLEVFNIKWVLRRASLRGQAAVRKVPFLAVMLRNLDVTHVDAQALLRDKTGEMNATIASSVMEEYGPVLQTGSVLLLRGVTVLSPVGVRTTSREHLRKHYLNITLNTVVTIYTPDDSGNVVTTLISEVDKNELYNEAAAPKTAACSRAIVEEEEDEIMDMPLNNNQSLFSLNDSITRNSPHPNQVSFNQKQLPNYRSPKVGGNNSAQNFSPRVQSKNNLRLAVSENGPRLQSGVSSVLPGITNSPQSRGFQFSHPRVSAPVRNYSARHERPQLRAQQPQNTSSSQRKPFFSFRPTGQQDATSASGRTSSDPCVLFFNSNNQIQETDEKEVRDLLNSVDADSLFGDF